MVPFERRRSALLESVRTTLAPMAPNNHRVSDIVLDCLPPRAAREKMVRSTPWQVYILGGWNFQFQPQAIDDVLKLTQALGTK